MAVKKKVAKKAKTAKKPVKKTVKKTAPANKSEKGSVTRYMEALHGKTYTEADLVKGLNEDLSEAWKKLRAFAADLGPQRIYASPLCIMFAKKVCYFYVRPKKTFLEIWIFLPHKIEGLQATLGPGKKPKYSNLFKLVHADQVEEPLTDWIREAFEFAAE